MTVEQRPPEEGDGSTLSTFFGAVADRTARHVLYCVDGADDAVAIGEVVERLGATLEEPAGADELAARLHHATLPTLEDAGFIEYDRRDGTIRYRGVGPCREFLEHAEWVERDRR